MDKSWLRLRIGGEPEVFCQAVWVVKVSPRWVCRVRVRRSGFVQFVQFVQF
jgi:hypothetical protein